MMLDAALAAVLVALINMLGSVLLRLVDAYFKHKDKVVDNANGHTANIQPANGSAVVRDGGHGVPVPGPGNPTHTGTTPVS